MDFGIEDERAVKMSFDWAIRTINPGLEHVDLEPVPQEVVDSVWERVKRKYEGRPYHSLSHVRYAIDKITEVRGDYVLQNADAPVILALIFHDAVQGENAEQKSHNFFRRWLGRYFPSDDYYAIVIKKGIIATDYSQEFSIESPYDWYAGLVRDADLCILGEQNHELHFSWYFAGILQEYNHIEIDQFFPKRLEFMKKLIAVPQIYFTRQFGERYEWYTRETALREIEHWSGLVERLGRDE